MKKVVLFIFSLLLFIPTLVLARDDSIEVSFSKCIDGDTAEFLYEKEKIKARFLAIDTPETKHPTKGEEPFGKEASEFTCTTIKNAKKIVLEFDKNSDEKDRYDRYLVWIFVDNKLFQELIIKEGFAEVAYLYGDYKYTEELKEIEKIAKENQVGIWGDYVKAPNYTAYIVVGLFILSAIIAFIIPKIKNKDIKKLAKTGKKTINKELKTLLKKIGK